jgi:SsrA-binding protein
VHIPPYKPAARDNHPPERTRKLLLHRRQIDRMAGQLAERGYTLVPTRIYFKDGRAKVELALAQGKDRFDKRTAIRDREMKRDVQRQLREAGR